MAALQAVRSKIAILKESVDKNRAEGERLTSTPPGSKSGGESCDHCRICGSSDHWACGCRKKNSTGDNAGSGYRRRLQSLDMK